MFTLKCKVAGCVDKKTGKRFVTQPKPTEGLAKQALAMHVLRKHGNMQGAPQAMAAKKKSLTQTTTPKRKYTRRKPEVVVEEGCPKCAFLTDLCHTLLEAVKAG